MKNNNVVINKINKFDDQIYSNSITKISDFVNDKYNKVHKELYNEALTSYLTSYLSNIQYTQSLNDYKLYHKFIEIKQNEYWKPSKVIQIDKQYPFNKVTIDLTSYWNKYQYETVKRDISYLYIDDDTTKDAEIIYIDYVNGKVKFKSKFTGVEFWTTTDYITETSKYSKEYFLANTFTYMINNNLTIN